MFEVFTGEYEYVSEKEQAIWILQQQQNQGRRFGTSKIWYQHLSPPPPPPPPPPGGLGCCPFTGGGSVVADLLFIVTPFVGFCNCSMFCCTFLYVPSSFGEERAGCLLSLSSWCLVIVVWLFLAMPWVCLQFVIVLFPDHTHYF